MTATLEHNRLMSTDRVLSLIFFFIQLHVQNLRCAQREEEAEFYLQD